MVDGLKSVLACIRYAVAAFLATLAICSVMFLSIMIVGQFTALLLTDVAMEEMTERSWDVVPFGLFVIPLFWRGWYRLCRRTWGLMISLRIVSPNW